MPHVTGYGIDIDLRSGWEGQLRVSVAEEEGEAPAVRMVVANFSLPPSDDDFGSAARAKMGAGGVHVGLLEYADAIPNDQVPETNDKIPGSPFQPARTPIQLETSDLLNSYENVPPDQLVGQKTFSLAGRCFQLRVVFGTREPSNTLFQELNGVLSTLSVNSS